MKQASKSLVSLNYLQAMRLKTVIHKTLAVILWLSLACYFPTQCSKELANEEHQQQQFLK